MARPMQAMMSAVTAIVLPGVLGACAQIPLHANLTDAQYRVALDEHFRPGMTRSEVEETLDGLKVSTKTRLWYDLPPAPPQLLVRIFEAGGFWLNDDDQTVQWVDTVFVFGREDPEPLLGRVETFRQRQRYSQGEPVNIPDEPTMHRWGDYPMPPPPPARPRVTHEAEHRVPEDNTRGEVSWGRRFR